MSDAGHKCSMNTQFGWKHLTFKKQIVSWGSAEARNLLECENCGSLCHISTPLGGALTQLACQSSVQGITNQNVTMTRQKLTLSNSSCLSQTLSNLKLFLLQPGLHKDGLEGCLV